MKETPETGRIQATDIPQTEYKHTPQEYKRHTTNRLHVCRGPITDHRQITYIHTTGIQTHIINRLQMDHGYTKNRPQTDYIQATNGPQANHK